MALLGTIALAHSLAVGRGIRATLVAPPIGGAVRVGTRAHLVVGVVVHAVAPAIRLAIVVIIPFVAVVAPAVVGCEMRAVRVGVRASPVTGLWRGVVPWAGLHIDVARGEVEF